MKKKGFTLTEIVIAITIIGILSILGMNFVKKNVSRYDTWYYYQAYDALTKGFADAIEHNVNTGSSQSLCNYLLTIWNIDSANSSCTATAQLSVFDKFFANNLFKNMFALPVYAVGQVAGYGNVATNHNGGGFQPVEHWCYYGYVWNDNTNMCEQYMPNLELACYLLSIGRYSENDLIHMYPAEGFPELCENSSSGSGSGNGNGGGLDQPEQVSLNDLSAVGSIKTRSGLQFDFYPETVFYQDDETNETYSYYVIKAEFPNRNLAPAYFLVYSRDQEILPITPFLIDNKNLLPTYIVTDYQDFKNNAVTGFINYRSAKCDKDEETNDFIPGSHVAYSSFVGTNELEGNYPSLYCSQAQQVEWLDSGAADAPKKSLTIKTSRPAFLK